jgi:metallo-beta-lactamase family protein
VKITFLGAAQTVTGSKYLVESGGARVLVDCGLFQGLKELRLRNRVPFAVSPASIDAVVLTHAHIDHSGYLPVLVRNGFKGRILCTAATLDLCRILLPDSGHLQEEEARYANKKGFSKHQPALPLYTVEDAEHCLTAFQAIDFGIEHPIAQGLKLRFERAGHILGAAVVYLTESANMSILFSGDLGRKNDPLLRPPRPRDATEYLVIESTYGDRYHDSSSAEAQLAEIVGSTTARGGKVIIPAFSVGRSQLILYYLQRLLSAGRIPRIPVYLNSPMSINATGLFCEHPSEHRLTPAECQAMCEVATYVRTPEESRRLNQLDGPAVIISANGMATGGRVIHHLKAYAPDPRNTILLTGYQATGTRGASLLNGASVLRIHGGDVSVRAQVRALHNLSAHGDQRELIDWVRNCAVAPKRIFVTHGEPLSARALASRLHEELGVPTSVPAIGDSEDL